MCLFLKKKKKLQIIAKNSQKPNNLYLISHSHLRALWAFKLFHLRSYIDNSHATNHFIHKPVSITNSLDQLVSLTQSVKKKIFIFWMIEFIDFNVLLTLRYTWHACINGNTRVKQQQFIVLCLIYMPPKHVCDLSISNKIWALAKLM